MFHYFVISSKTHQKNLTYCIFLLRILDKFWFESVCLVERDCSLHSYLIYAIYTELTKDWLYFAFRIDVKSSNTLIPIKRRQFNFFIPRGESCEVRGSISNCCWLKLNFNRPFRVNNCSCFKGQQSPWGSITNLKYPITIIPLFEASKTDFHDCIEN